MSKLIEEIKSLKISNRARNVLCRYCYKYEISSIDEIRSHGQQQLMRQYGLGRKCAEEIIDAVKSWKNY